MLNEEDGLLHMSEGNQHCFDIAVGFLGDSPEDGRPTFHEERLDVWIRQE
jgi:hypothetical protein